MVRGSGDRRLIVASRNRGKMEEFKKGLGGLGIMFLSLHDFPHLPPIIEDGSTFRENACKKAVLVAAHTQLPILADDSGLEVDYLDGAPGVLSARFAGSNADDEANNRKLLRLLAGVPYKERKARFRCALVLALHGKPMVTVESTVEGYIGIEMRGEGGFGYDPLFIVPEYKSTFAELGPDIKNVISHRGRALRQMRDYLLKLGWGAWK